MTNKLRSVIEENIQYLSGYGASRGAVLECELGLLDAIIEEIEEQRWRTTKNSYNSAQNELIDFFTEKLKQAREELSTSLTQ